MTVFFPVGNDVGAELDGDDVGRLVSPFFVGFEVIGRFEGRLDGWRLGWEVGLLEGCPEG